MSLLKKKGIFYLLECDLMGIGFTLYATQNALCVNIIKHKFMKINSFVPLSSFSCF